MQLYDAIKAAVTAEDIAIRYAGLNPQKKGGTRSWARCPLHEDKTPSLMFDGQGRYYCFSCNSNGSAIDFLAAYLRVSQLEAAQMIARDYQLNTGKTEVHTKPPKPVKREDKRNILYRLICDAKHNARQYQEARAAADGEAALDDELFCASVHLVSKADGEWLDILQSGTDEEAAALIEELQAVVGV